MEIQDGGVGVAKDEVSLSKLGLNYIDKHLGRAMQMFWTKLHNINTGVSLLKALGQLELVRTGKKNWRTSLVPSQYEFYIHCTGILTVSRTGRKIISLWKVIGYRDKNVREKRKDK